MIHLHRPQADVICAHLAPFSSDGLRLGGDVVRLHPLRERRRCQPHSLHGGGKCGAGGGVKRGGVGTVVGWFTKQGDRTNIHFISFFNGTLIAQV